MKLKFPSEYVIKKYKLRIFNMTTFATYDIGIQLYK